jgi:2-polyprenyl-3-methyl-5-hydroxy-6-metoxy-1,4-benzoquinol methylase
MSDVSNDLRKINGPQALAILGDEIPDILRDMFSHLMNVALIIPYPSGSPTRLMGIIANTQVLEDISTWAANHLRIHNGTIIPDEWRARIYDCSLELTQPIHKPPLGPSDQDQKSLYFFDRSGESVDCLTVADVINHVRNMRANRAARIVEECIGSFLPLCDNPKVLDVGCGSGVIARDLSQIIPSVQIDGYDPADYQIPNMPSNFSRIDLKDIKKSHYDIVMLNWVLHHAQQGDHEKIAQICKNALQNPGLLIVHETAWSDDVGDVPLDSDKKYARAYLRDMVSSMGMTPRNPQAKTSIAGYYPSDHWNQLFGRHGLSVVRLSEEHPVLNVFCPFDEFCEITRTHFLYHR